MDRRAFIAALGGAAAWPVVGRAQQSAMLIGFLSGRSHEESAGDAAAFRDGLKEMGYVEGRNLAIDPLRKCVRRSTVARRSSACELSGRTRPILAVLPFAGHRRTVPRFVRYKALIGARVSPKRQA